MKTRGTPTICLGPTGNLQGTFNFLNLVNDLVIKRCRFDKLPAPDSVIARVASLIGKKGIFPTLP